MRYFFVKLISVFLVIYVLYFFILVVEVFGFFYSIFLSSRVVRSDFICLEYSREVFGSFGFFFYGVRKFCYVWKVGSKINRVEEKNRKNGRVWDKNKRGLIF